MNQQSSSKTLISQEQQHNRWLYSAYIILMISGFTNWLLQNHTMISQWFVLLHSLSGLVFVSVLPSFTYIHFCRTLGQRRALLILSGIALIAALVCIAISGLLMILQGQLSVARWRLDFHIFSALLSIFLLAAHIVLHHFTLPKRRKESGKPLFPSFPENLRHTVAASNIILTALVFSVSLIYMVLNPKEKNLPAVADYQYPYGKHPFRPSQTETFNNDFVEKKFIANSENCAHCHIDIAEQWKSSIHKQAASDPTYVTNITLLVEKKGIAAARYCEGCHAPVALLTGQLSEGGDHGGIANTIAFNEGISCLSCHSINKEVHLKGVASYEYKPHHAYLFYGSDNPILKHIHRFLLRTDVAQHRTDMARPILSDSKLCATCHVQFMDKDMNNWGWVKMQDEYTAWLESPYSKQSEHSFSHDELARCQDCHMPLVDSDDPSANSDGKVRSHRFLGANTMMPTLNRDHEQFMLTKLFLQNNKVRISIERPHRDDATQSGLFIDESLRTRSETPAYFYLNEEANIEVVVSNNGIGHNFPAGTLDINQVWIEFSVIDASGRMVYHSGYLQDDLFVDPEAHFYRSRPIDRHGREVWKHDLFNRVGETYKKFVEAGKSDVVKYNFPIPSWTESPITVTAVLKYRKLNQRYALWALRDEYRELPIVDVSRHTISIPIREQSPVTNKRYLID